MRRIATSFAASLWLAGCGPLVSDDNVDGDGGSAAETVGVEGGEGIDDVDDGGEVGTSSATGVPPNPSTTADPSTATTAGTADDGGATTLGLPPVQGLVGAAFFADGLCPWEYDYSDPVPLLNLQVSGSSLVCNMIMWRKSIELGLHPTWFAELHFSFDHVGVYDLAQNPGVAWINVIDPDTSGGAAGGPLQEGIVEIVSIDEAAVVGSLSGLPVFNLNGVDYDVNGSFAAARCTPDEWLDADPGEPHEPPLPRGCLHP